LLESRKESADKTNEALDLQRKAAADLQELARELRGPKDRLQALREARQRIDEAGQNQDAPRQEAQAAMDNKGKERPEDAARQAQAASDKQARLEHMTRDTRNLLKPHAQDVANKITPAENRMAEAQQALRKNDPKEAVDPQAKAAETLKDVRKDLD